MELDHGSPAHQEIKKCTKAGTGCGTCNWAEQNLGEIRDLTGLGPGYSSLGIIAPFDPFQLG